MINFKEHDGLLFKMLDKPVPLTPDAEMPCLVRFRVPFSKRFKGKHDGVAFFCDAIKKNPLYGNRLYAYETRRVGCIAEPRELEIIGTLVEEGSKEWALYQMMQGKWVYNPCLEKHKSDKSDTRCLHAYSKFGQDVVVKNILTGVDSILGAANISHWTNYAEPTGWKLYEEPKPESENIIHGHIPADMRLKYIDLGIYNVGDWVEHKESKEQATIRRIMSYGAIEIEFAYSTESDIYQANDFHNDFRKLSPSEVIVKIGCLEGTVRKYPNARFRLINGVFVSIIDINMLDTPTRELVESLLKAQEEK